MCKFNLTDAITTSIDPLAGWIDQKAPPPAWDYPMVAPPLPEEVLPSFELPPSQALLAPPEEGLIPDDLQGLFEGVYSEPVPALPTSQANDLIDELFSEPSASPPLFSALSPVSPLSPACPEPVPLGGGGSPVPCAPPEAAVEMLPPPALSPDPMMPQQLSMDRWVPTLSPPLSEPFSPLSGCEESRGLPAPPDWTPSTLAPPTKRRQARPRPYDKQARRQITEEERRLRKKEQNKSAATRYRQKKKEEQEMVTTDQEQLEQKNAQLRQRVDTLTHELDYLKHLMQQVMQFKRSL